MAIAVSNARKSPAKFIGMEGSKGVPRTRAQPFVAETSLRRRQGAAAAFGTNDLETWILHEPNRRGDAPAPPFVDDRNFVARFSRVDEPLGVGDARHRRAAYRHEQVVSI